MGHESCPGLRFSAPSSHSSEPLAGICVSLSPYPGELLSPSICWSLSTTNIAIRLLVSRLRMAESKVFLSRTQSTSSSWSGSGAFGLDGALLRSSRVGSCPPRVGQTRSLISPPQN